MVVQEIKIKIQECLKEDRYFSAMYFCQQLLKIESNDYWQFQYGNVLRLCGLFAKAKKIFLMIDVKNIPEKYKYLYHLYFGQLLMDMKDVENAKEELKKCMEFENCDTVPYVYLSSLLIGEGNNDEAIYYLTKGLEKEGDIDEVYYNLAIRYAIKEDFGLALNAIDNCLKLNYNYPNASNVRNDLISYIKLTTQTDSMH